MRFLLDQGVPATAASLLTKHGLEVTHISEMGMSRAADTEILEYARTHGFVVVTLDADFHTLLALGANNSPSVIRVRQEGLDAIAFARLLQAIMPKIAAALQSGAAITVTATQVRIRRLPVGSSRSKEE